MSFVKYLEKCKEKRILQGKALLYRKSNCEGSVEERISEDFDLLILARENLLLDEIIKKAKEDGIK